MNLLILCLTLSTVAASPTAPIRLLDDILYTANNTCYTAEYDIVDVHFPVGFITEHAVFLIQADLVNNLNKGAYLLHIYLAPNGDYRNVTSQKLLDNGKCITSDGKRVYFGATDGIYIYNFSNNTIEKYGTITADIKDIEKDKERDLIYIVTEDNKLYLVTESGNKMAEHNIIRNVQEIAMDAGSNLYFYEKHDDPEIHLQFFEKYGTPKVLVGDKIVNISGLPDKYANIKLESVLIPNGTVVILNNIVYNIYPDGTCTQRHYAFLDLPTSCSMEAGLIQLYGLHKKLYCYIVDLSPLIDAVLRKVSETLKKKFTPV